jgi:Uma2 family endonuclease
MSTPDPLPDPVRDLPPLEPGKPAPPEYWPDLDALVTEDDAPVDNLLSEKQQRLLTEALYASWEGPEDGFLATANVGLFYQYDRPPLVPDGLLSLHTRPPQEDLGAKANRSYFVWIRGKPPEVVVEVVSNREGGEDTDKLATYARIGVTYYAIFDPFHCLGEELLRIYALHEGRYERQVGGWLQAVGLGLTLWEGEIEGVPGTWLRWCDAQGNALATGAERAEREQRRAEEEHRHAQQAEAQAQQERARAERLAARLREMGIDPDA